MTPSRRGPHWPAGHGSKGNPPNRFEPLALELDGDWLDEEGEPPHPRTQYLRDHSKSVLSTNQSPDIPFVTSLNPYRGCVHACAYCYARPTHEYLGLSAGLDFETRIFVKEDAPVLLARALASPRWRPQVIALSGVTDPYQPVERRLRITRRCLEVLAEFRNPVGVITKSGSVTRDLDVLTELAEKRAVTVTLSVTTLDPDLARRLEPRAAQPRARLAAIEALARAAIPVGVNVAPVIPGLNDHEIPAIVAAAAQAGARFAGHIMLRLPHGVAELFADWLDEHAPQRKGKVLAGIRSVRGGKLDDPRFGQRMRGSGPYAAQIHDLFALACTRAGLSNQREPLSVAAFRSPRGRQLSLF